MPGRRSRDQFDARKAAAATALLVQGTGEQMYPVMKMMYLADRFHLERYGRFIAGDTYAAMKEGPVPCQTYNLMKHIRGVRQDIEGADVMGEFIRYGENHRLTLNQAPDLDELSESEIECLEHVISLYRQLGRAAVVDLAHDLSWRETWEGRSIWKKSVRMPIEAIASRLDVAEVLLEHLSDPQPGAA